MPKATVNIDEFQKFELKTCEGAFVHLRRLPYGLWLKRQEMALQMKINPQARGNDATGELAMANRKVTEFEFAHCIIEHNLEDDEGNLLDFKNPRTLDTLNPKIGNEIGTYISDLHEFGEAVPN